MRGTTISKVRSIFLGILIIFTLWVCAACVSDAEYTSSSISAPSSSSASEPTPSFTPTPTPDPRVEYVFDLNNFDTVVTITGDQYSIEDCMFLEDGKILITTNKDTDEGIVIYLKYLELYNTNVDPNIEYFNDETFGSAGYYNSYDYLSVEDDEIVVRKNQEIINAYDIMIGNTPCVIVRYYDENENLIEKIIKKDNIILKNTSVYASVRSTHYPDALEIDTAYEGFEISRSEDGRYQTYTRGRAYIDAPNDRLYFIGRNKAGQDEELSVPLHQMVLLTESPIDIPDTAIDMGIDISGIYLQIFFQNDESPTYGQEIYRAYIEGDLIYITYRDSNRITISHLYASQIISPFNVSFKDCFELEDPMGLYGLGNIIPENYPVPLGPFQRIVDIGNHRFYFISGSSSQGRLSSMEQNTSSRLLADYGYQGFFHQDYSEEGFIIVDEEVDFNFYRLGIDNNFETREEGYQSDVEKYRYITNYNGRPYIEMYSVTYRSYEERYLYDIAFSLLPAESMVISGINLSAFKEEGVVIFDISQGIDEVSAING